MAGSTAAGPAHRSALLAGIEHGFAVQAPADVRLVKQVHGAVVVVVSASDEPMRLSAYEGDGLMTSAPGVALGARSADCAPVLLADPRSGAVGAAHAGWRGVVGGVVPATVTALLELGARASDLRVALGPSIGPCCFEVGDEVAARFPAATVHARTGGKPTVDLRHALLLQLAACGVTADRIDAAAPCTYCDPAGWPSYRRQGTAAGRLVGWIRHPS